MTSTEVLTVEHLDALRVETVIREAHGFVLERLSDGWYRPGVPDPYPTGNRLMLPAVILWRPNSRRAVEGE